MAKSPPEPRDTTASFLGDIVRDKKLDEDYRLRAARMLPEQGAEGRKFLPDLQYVALDPSESEALRRAAATAAAAMQKAARIALGKGPPRKPRGNAP